MATYLPNVNKYVSKTESFTPNFKFISDALAQRQDRYDTNYRKMNNLYGSVVHADLTRQDNKDIRDNYAKELAPKLQQISGVDFSLQQNVDAAKALFTPFFNDNKMVRDIVFTKRHQSEMQKFQNFRQSNDEETRKRYWDEGVLNLNYSLADFQKGSRDESMNVQLPEAVENINLVEMGINALKELGISDEQVSLDATGNYMITQKNGSALTKRAIGKNDKGDMVYTNPAQELILQMTMDDPKVQRYYQTKFYVKARQFYEANAEKYGGEEAAKKVFSDDMLSQYFQDYESQKIGKEAEVKSATEAKNDWESYRKKHGNFIPGSQEELDYSRAKEEYLLIKNGRKLEDKHHRLVSGESENIDDMFKKASQAYMMHNINSDTREAAKFYSMIDAKQTIEADDFALKNHQHALNMAEKEFQNALDIMKDKGWQQDQNGNWMPLPWADLGSSGNSNTEGQDVGVDYFMGGQGTDVVAGDAEETMPITDGESDPIADNTIAISNKINGMNETRFNSIERYYSQKSSDLSDDDNTLMTEGIKVDGKFLSWEEAKEYYLDPVNKDKLKEKYDIVDKILKGEDTGPGLLKSNPGLYYQLKKNKSKIESDGVAVLVTRDKQNEITQNVIDLLVANNEITPAQANLLNAYPLFNAKGEMQEPEEIVGKMQSGFINWYDKVHDNLPYYRSEIGSDASFKMYKIQKEVFEQAARQFGFQDVDALLDALYPWNVPTGTYKKVHTKSGQRAMDKVHNKPTTGITFMADKHFKNMYDETFGRDSAADLFNDVKNKVNKRMTNANAIPGVTSFNAASMLTNQEQGGIGGTIYNKYKSEYINGQVNPAANTQFRLLNELLKQPKQNYSVTVGDASGEYTAVTNQEALTTLNQIIKDTMRNPGDFTKGKGPNVTITWSEVLGGPEGKGNHSGWVITLGNAYADDLETTLGPILDVKDNQITVFATKEFGQNNPNAVKNTYVSTTEFIVDLDKSRIINNDGGSVMFYRNSSGQMMHKYRLATYNKELGQLELSDYSEPQVISAGGYAVDQVYELYDKKLNEQEGTNLSAINAHKKENQQSK